MSDLKTALEIVNIVLERLGVNAVESLGETKLSTMATEQLNDILDDISAYGEWPQMYREAVFQTIPDVGEYKLNIAAQNVVEICVSGQTSPLNFMQISEIRRLQRGSGKGIPRHCAIVKVSALAPYVRVAPIPANEYDLVVAYYTRPVVLAATAAYNSITVPFPARTVVQGLYAVMLLEESGNTPTTEVAAAMQLYEKYKRESMAAFTYDTGDCVQFAPHA